MKVLRPGFRKQQGAAAVEFALIGMLFFILLFGVLEIGRVMFTWNSAVEATRYGARVAAVCNMNDAAILSRMQRIMPSLVSSNVNVAYLPTGCSTSTCQYVRVSMTNFQMTTHIPVISEFLDPMLNLPSFGTTIPRESLESSHAEGTSTYPNPVCN